MIDNIFFCCSKKKIYLKDLIYIDKNIQFISQDTCNFKIAGISTLENAKKNDITFFTHSIIDFEKRKKQLLTTKASYVFIQKEYAKINQNIIPIITNTPYLTFLQLCKTLIIEKKENITKTSISSQATISKFSSISENVVIEDNSIIEDFVKISSGVKIGKNCIIKAGAKIGKNCVIGDNCIIGENCVINFAVIGDNFSIHSNSTIGSDGFGYINDDNLNTKIPHFSYVEIGNNVEIGSNTAIDRGVFNPTTICDNVKIDNLVQIGHNVKIKNNTIICGQTGIAGSATIEKNCLLGARSGILNNIKVGANSIIHASSLITKDVKENSRIIGNPGENYRKWSKNRAKINIFLKNHFF